MAKPQHKAVSKFRQRLKQKGLTRLEVHVRENDAGLVRNVVRALLNPEQREEVRALLRDRFGSGQPKGLKALLAAAPLEGMR